jgi:uncharacterized membrane protein
MDIKGININNVNNVNMMSNNTQVRDNASNTNNTQVKDNANNTREKTDSVVDNPSVEKEEVIQLTPNITMKKRKNPLSDFLAITLEEIRDGKKYRSYVDIYPSKGRVSVDIFGTSEEGKSVLLRSYDIRQDMIMDNLGGLKSTLPREVIDILFLLKKNGINFGKVNIEEIANRKPNKIYDLSYRVDGMGLYKIIGGIVGASIYGAMGVRFGPISTVLYTIFGGLLGLSIGTLLESNEYIKYASKGNKYLEKKEK